jgi:glycerol-3-phosphate dehydrogenase
MSIDSSQKFDVAIVGAGACGAAIAYEAATRGLKVLLAEKGDFGSGTSANSLKIVHGGLRYLQNLDFGRARSSTLERSMFLRNAASLVRPLQCVMPTGWERGKSRLIMGGGLALNAAVTFDRNRDVPAPQRLPAGGIVSRSELTRLAQGLHMKGVTGGASWFDAIMTDSERLSLALVMSARDAGASVHNYLSVERLLTSGGSAVGVAVRDQITGDEYEIRTRAVVSCQGPWAHTADASPFGQIGGPGLLKAVNVILPNANLKCAVGFPPRDGSGQPRGGRLLFAVPWLGRTMVGTWYFSPAECQEHLTVTPAELDSVLHELNSGFEDWDFGREDILMLHIGQLPVRAGYPSNPEPITAPLIAESIEFGGLRRAWIVQGEKWCTARRTAQKVVDIVAKSCGFDISESVSSRNPLNVGPEELTDEVPVPGCQRPAESSENIEALTYSLRNEMVRTLPDLLLRRTNIGAGGRPPPKVTEQISRLAASELGWDEADRLRNVDAIHRHSRYPSD